MGKGVRQHSFLHCSTSYIRDNVVADQSTPAQSIVHNKCWRMSVRSCHPGCHLSVILAKGHSGIIFLMSKGRVSSQCVTSTYLTQWLLSVYHFVACLLQHRKKTLVCHCHPFWMLLKTLLSPQEYTLIKSLQPCLFLCISGCLTYQKMEPQSGLWRKSAAIPRQKFGPLWKPKLSSFFWQLFHKTPWSYHHCSLGMD